MFRRPCAMDLLLIFKLHLLISMLLLCQQARGDGSGSVIFLDSPGHRYLRNHPSGIAGETSSMLLSEVAATISVLLGFAPSASLPVESSAKLDEVLLPNPFDRPCAVIILEVKGADNQLLPISYSNAHIGSTFSTKVLASNKTHIELPDDEISVISVDEPIQCDAACIDKELGELAHWLGGSYGGSVESVDSKLTFPLASGSSLNLHVSKQADLGFALGLVSLVRGIKKAVEVHEDFARSIQSPSELLTGCFTGIGALSEYGPDVAQQGIELLQTTLVKVFDLLQKSYQGKIVGVILFNEEPSPKSGSMLDVKLSTQVSRFLEEVGSVNATISEVLLVRRSLAWITGIILLVSTLIGIFLLLNMPLTRDTLLYSNVKLD